MRVLALTKYGRAAASTRQRLLQYLPALEAAGIGVVHRALLADAYVESLASGTGYSRLRVVPSYMRRLRDLLSARTYDALWVYAELFPYLPAPFERLAFSGGTPVIYDFDDAFFHQYDHSSSKLRTRVLSGKLVPLMEGAAACCCGNMYLHDYARQYNENSTILPTVVDTKLYCPKRGQQPLVIGWIGSPSTWGYVKPYLPLLQEICSRHGALLRIVGAGAEAERHRFAGLELVKWTEATEVNLVQSMDIGIMPLPDEPWARGKSGYKLIQYGACGLPIVASPVGVNSEIVIDGETGFVARGELEWRDAMTRLITDADLRERMGRAGRIQIEQRYSLKAHAPRFVEIIRRAVART
jgi:glycosyltransferase involved in cell wall biosynthesis